MDQFTTELLTRISGQKLRVAAEALGTTEATICRLRKGKRRPGRLIISNALLRWPDLLYFLAASSRKAS